MELKRLTMHCGFGDVLTENLTDAFTAGVKDFNIRKKLLSIKTLTWEKAQEEALFMEGANRDAARLTPNPKNLLKYIQCRLKAQSPKSKCLSMENGSR